MACAVVQNWNSRNGFAQKKSTFHNSRSGYSLKLLTSAMDSPREISAGDQKISYGLKRGGLWPPEVSI
jgi:hypothetical protein